MIVLPEAEIRGKFPLVHERGDKSLQPEGVAGFAEPFSVSPSTCPDLWTD